MRPEVFEQWAVERFLEENKMTELAHGVFIRSIADNQLICAQASNIMLSDANDNDRDGKHSC